MLKISDGIMLENLASGDYSYEYRHNCKEYLKKRLKVLEIIKKYIKLEGHALYAIMYIWELSQEEYDLLKEVLYEQKTDESL